MKNLAFREWTIKESGAKIRAQLWRKEDGTLHIFDGHNTYPFSVVCDYERAFYE